MKFLFVALALASQGCNNPSCGPGTKQVQAKDGTTQCQPVDASPDAIVCDADGGATLVAGKCVSSVTCGPNTMLVNGQCIGTGGNGLPPCPTPAPGKFCVNGALLNLVDNVASTERVAVAVFDATALPQPNPVPLGGGVFTGNYVLSDLTPPNLGIIAVVVGDPDGKAMDTMFVNCATGDQGIAGDGKYRVDAYVLPLSVALGWRPGFDFAKGGFLARFFNDPRHGSTMQIADETHPVAGVTLTKNGSPDTTAKYFSTSLTTVDTSLTMTGPIGAAITVAPAASGFPTFSGMGGGITWEQQPGGSTAGIIVVGRLHPM